MISFSVSRSHLAVAFRAMRKKNDSLICSSFHAVVRGISTKTISPLFLFKPMPRRTVLVVKTNRKKCLENHNDEKLDCMCGYTGRHVYFEGFVFS